MATVRCTMAQALVPFLCNRFTIIDGERALVLPGAFAIFGHGTSPAFRTRSNRKDRLPIRCGQNEPSTALVAIGFAKAKRRRQIMVSVLLDERKSGLFS